MTHMPCRDSLTTQILICMIWMVPESHIHYARKGDHENAKKSMLRLYGTAPEYDVVSQPTPCAPPPDARQEYEYRVVQHGIEAERAFSAAAEGASYADIFRGLNWKRTLAGCMGILSQPFAGAPIVFGYSTVGQAQLFVGYRLHPQYFFKVAGLADPFLVTIITWATLLLSRRHNR